MFVKFPSIFHPTDINLGPNRAFNATVDRWVITEKVDGSNFSIIINRNDRTFEVAKRTTIINDSISDIWNLWRDREKLFTDFVNKIVDNFTTDADEIIVYGEWFGPTIMRRVDYGDVNDWRVFALSTVTNSNVTPASFKELETIVNIIGYTNHLVPILGFANTIEDALKFDNATESILSPSHSVMEGIVIAPYSIGSNIRYKSKNEKFAEKENNPNRYSYDASIVARANELREIFKSYCNENRMYTVFSKFGAPQSSRDAGKYISEFAKDALNDFVHDYPEFNEIEDKSVVKMIMNLGKHPFNIYKLVESKLVNNGSNELVG